MLRRVRQLEKKLMMTDGRLPPIREVLSRFSTRLKEAQSFLLKAANAVQETADKNRASILKFQRAEVISHNSSQHSLKSVVISTDVSVF